MVNKTNTKDNFILQTGRDAEENEEIFLNSFVGILALDNDTPKECRNWFLSLLDVSSE